MLKECQKLYFGVFNASEEWLCDLENGFDSPPHFEICVAGPDKYTVDPGFQNFS